MRLAKATFKKVGPFKDFSIEFKKNKKKNLAEVHILTGPNGSGKSTILKGLANAFNTGHSGNFSELFWTTIENGGWIDVDDRNGEFIKLFSSKWFINDTNVSFHKYSKQIDEYRSTDKETELSYAVFGYSGHRSLNTQAKFNLGFPNINPLDGAVNFERPLDSPSHLANWAGNILAQEAFAGQKKDTKSKLDASSNLKKFESILAEITGREIKFNMDYEVMRLNMLLDGKEVEFSVLPDGLKSMLGWLGDMLMRMESIRWKEKCSVFDQPIILFLDEIDIHLHPSWQKKILPIIQKTFVNAQIFVSTHSPFVVASVEDAFVYDLNIGKDGHSFLENVIHTEKGQTYSRVLKEIFDVDTEFADPWTEKKLDSFYELLKQAKSKKTKAYQEAFSVGKELAEASIELRDIVSVELNQLDRRIAAVK